MIQVENKSEYYDKKVKILNDVLGDVILTPKEENTLKWLLSWDIETVQNIVTAFSKVKNQAGDKIISG